MGKKEERESGTVNIRENRKETKVEAKKNHPEENIGYAADVLAPKTSAELLREAVPNFTGPRQYGDSLFVGSSAYGKGGGIGGHRLRRPYGRPDTTGLFGITSAGEKKES